MNEMLFQIIMAAVLVGSVMGLITSLTLLVLAIKDIVSLETDFAYWFRWYVFGQRSIKGCEQRPSRFLIVRKGSNWVLEDDPLLPS